MQFDLNTILDSIGTVNNKISKAILESTIPNVDQKTTKVFKSKTNPRLQWDEEKRESKKDKVETFSQGKHKSETNTATYYNKSTETKVEDVAQKEIPEFLKFTHESLIQSFVVSEILGKPVSMRRR